MALLDSMQLVIFDKDGTLIDLNTMWGGWIEELARRLEQHSGRSLAGAFFDALGYDAAARRAVARGHLAVASMQELYTLSWHFLQAQGLPETVLQSAWFIPDPVASARPVTELRTLFQTLRSRGLQLAVATTDDRQPTLTTLRALGCLDWVDTLVCGDDGIRLKPAPDMILTICQRLGVDPRHSLMVGDTLADMHMGQAAGAGRVVGVLTGASTAADLTPYAHAVVPSIAALLD